MKITKSQLKQIIKEELEKIINEEDSDAQRDADLERYGTGYKPKARRSFGSSMTDAEREAAEKSRAERDPDREYIEMIKRIMRDMPGKHVTPTDDRNKGLIAQAEKEFEREKKRPPGGGLGGPGGKARYPTPEEIAAAHANQDK